MTDLDREMCFAVALYGVAAREDDLQLLAEIDALFSAVGLAPSHLNVRAPGFSNKRLRFGPAWKRLHKTGLEGVGAVSLYTMVDSWQATTEWLAQCVFIRDKASLIICVGLEHVPDAVERILGFVLDRLARLRPGYGIGYLRPRDGGPFLYAMGMGYGRWDDKYEGPAYEEKRLIYPWLQGRRDAVYEQGILRDVYPYQLLTPRHLERDLVGVSLGAWIRARPWRGRIVEYPHEHALWTVDPEHLQDVRRALAARHGLYVMGPDNHLGPCPNAPDALGAPCQPRGHRGQR